MENNSKGQEQKNVSNKKTLEGETNQDNGYVRPKAFSSSGRINRLGYFLTGLKYTILAYLSIIILGIVAISVTGILGLSNSIFWGVIAGLLPTLIIYIILLILMYFLYIQRLHDLNINGKFALIGLIPAIMTVIFVIVVSLIAAGIITPTLGLVSFIDTANLIAYWGTLIFYVYLLFAPGTSGDNKYGPQEIDKRNILFRS